MRILVIGAGGVGGYFAAKLALAGHDVAVVARGAHGEAIREHGLVVDTPRGELKTRVAVLDDVARARGHDAEVILIAVKAHQLGEIASAIGSALAPAGVAIPLQNGLDSEGELAKIIGSERVIGGVAQMGAGILAPGRIYLRSGGSIVLAPLDREQQSEVERIVRIFAQAFPCTAESDLQTVLWRKLLWNAPFNAICALTRRRPGDVLAFAELEQLVRGAMHEILAVARAEGTDVDESTIEDLIGVTRRKLAEIEPSMLQDVLAGRPSETEALQGAVVERARRHGLSTPIMNVLYALMRGLEQR
jgi:2-dehydropantoate 2-reductase